MAPTDLSAIFVLGGILIGFSGIVTGRAFRRPPLAIAGLTIATVGILGYVVIAAITATTVLNWVFIAITTGILAYIVKKLIDIFRARLQRRAQNNG